MQDPKATKIKDPDNVIGLVSEVLPDRSCLIFCPSKKQCENLTNNIITLTNRALLSPPNKVKQRLELLKLLEVECVSICPILKKSILLGVAYHHSGLTHEERKLVEEGFLDGTISVICCTSTLAAGVNLPARRVIIRAPYVAKDFIKYSQYKQMAGRAGRAGFDTEGESIVILNAKDKDKFTNLMIASSSHCHSSLLADSGRMIKYFVLSAISLELIKTFDDILIFLKDSLFNIQNPDSLSEVLKVEIQYLIDYDLVRQIKSEDGKSTILKSTELGKAVVKGSIDVVRAKQIYDNLKIAEKSLDLSSYFHLLYLVTPYDMIESIPPNWDIFSQRLKQLSEEEMSLLPKFGFDEALTSKIMIGLVSYKNLEDYSLKRLYLSLILYDLWNQQPAYVVADNYNQSRGQIQALLQSAVTFSACLSNFVDGFRTELWGFRELLPKFTTRLSHCVSPELIPLMEVQGIKRGRAAVLYKSGYKSVVDLATADFDVIYEVMKPISRNVANQILSSAKMIIQERVEALTEEVKDLITINSDSIINYDVDLVHSTPKKPKHADSFVESDLFHDWDLFVSD